MAEENVRLAADIEIRKLENAALLNRIHTLTHELDRLRLARDRSDRRPPAPTKKRKNPTAELRASYQELQAGNATLGEANAALESRIQHRTAELAAANTALSRREEELHFAQRCIGAGRWDWDILENRLSWSPECQDLMGFEFGIHSLTLDEVIARLPPNDRTRLRVAVEDVLNGADDEFRHEFRIRRRDGERWIVNFGRVVERDRRGHPIRVIGLVVDVTDRKELERNLRNAKDETERANSAKTRFVASASHDLRQPIQAAALYAHVLGRSLERNGNARDGEVLSLLSASIENLNAMLDGLLDLSRLEAGAVRVAIVDFVPDTLMLRLAAEFQDAATAVAMDLRCLPTSRPVTTDPHLLERILRNLLSNAVKHGAPAKGRRGRILFGCRIQGNRVVFQVCDDGPGIPPEACETIFEEFRQLKNPERDAAQGFGLGLAIVTRIARMLGLTVTLRSRLGGGTMFLVAVPAALTPAERLTEPEPDIDMTVRLRGRTVLVVEDDARVRRGLSLMLEGWGVSVIAMASVGELELALPGLPRRPDAMIVDYRLPDGATGGAAVDLVRRRWKVPALLVTGDTAPERLREAASLGCPLLHKPVAPDELIRALGRALAS